METLTKEQHKMLIENVATECAEEWPANDDYGFLELQAYWTKLLFQQGFDMNEYKFDIFSNLVGWIRDAQELDRDPGGYLNTRGHDDTEANREHWHNYIEDMIGTHIDRLA